MSEKPCAGCGTTNEADARFCEGCGTALERRCAACGTTARATARFCRSCGGSLEGPAQPAPAGPTRKTVTALFADLAGSTTFEEKVDAETAREVMGQYHDLLRQTAERHRAGVTKYIGDGFMAVWGVPEISASDADHAVDAAVELQQRFVDLAAQVAATHGEDLALRVAVNTGEVVVGSDDADLVGDALNVAARLESQCPHGHVVVGEETWRSTRGRYRYEPMTPVQVKGRAAPVAMYQWAGRRSEPADSVPFVGRIHEFHRLQTVLDDATARRVARLVTVIGDPGVGKTRLATEFARAQQDVVVLQIRCAAEGTVALAPAVEVLRTRDLEADLPAGVPERDRILHHLHGMTGGVAGSVEETFWGLRRYFEVLAAHRRLILVLDDIHWADALLLDFIEHLSEWVRDAPILMVALARPELRESRPELVTVGGWVGDAIRLGGLEPAATAELAAHVLGSDQLPSDLLTRLPSSTGGNPLFVRELVAMLVHDGVLVVEADKWRLTIDVDAISVPPTIQALLASRLERMNSADRRVLETASVIGTDFSPAAVCALSGASTAEVKASLDRLRRLELVQHSGAYTGDEPVWRFHHILIRDVAYRRLLKSDRADLHERFADWIPAGGRAGVFESDELVARHLESAYGYRCELGARDSGTAELALRSARCYLSAARRGLDRDALVSAGAQAARGAALASDDPALRAELLLVGCEAFLSAGDVAAGAALVDDLDRIADHALAPWATCYRCQYIVYTDPSRLPEIDERLQPAIDEFARRGDAGGTAKAYRVRANARGRLGRIGDAEADLFEALIAARKVGDHRQITAALGAAPNAALWGPSAAPKAGGRCLDVVRMQRMTTAAPSLEATSLRCLAVLELLRGRPDKARSMLADAREIVAELGLRHGLMETELYAGIIESMVGDPVAAEPHFRTALEGLDSLGVGADAGQAAALLARSLLAQGRMDEADRYAAESERIAGHNLKTAIGWRAVRAEILSAQGRHREAVAMAREAVEVAADTDLVLDYADACMTLNRVLADSGDGERAAEARQKAESLYAAKDAVFLVGTSSQRAAPPATEAPSAEAAGRLKVVNRACEVLLAGWQSLKLAYAEGLVYEDHRRVSGEPLRGADDFISAAKRKQEQYPYVETTVLAVRGKTLAFLSLRWWDDTGNETTSLDLYEIDESDRLAYHGRFDRDDFVGAYRALEQRYYAGEGAAFAANGLKVLAFEEAFWAQDVEAARATVQPDFRWRAAASALKPGERSLEELFEWRAERIAQVASFQDWLAALRWLSPDVCVSLCEIRATGRDGEGYRWNRYYVSEYRDGLSASVREFDIAEEDAAFAYAESLVARERGRLVVRNRASAVADGLFAELRAKDLSGAPSYAERLVYDDRRRIPGSPITCREDLLSAAQIAVQQYSTFDDETLAVRGERSALVSSRWSDAAGNETAHLHVFELNDQGLIVYEGRFDADDFAGAYRVLEERYYAGEGRALAIGGLALLGFQTAIWAQDVEAARRLVQPDFVWRADPSTLKPGERSLDEMFTWRADRLAQVASFHDWLAALEWLSPQVCVSLVEMRGEEYRWPRLYVVEYRDGLILSGREFDVDDEDAAFVYAQSLVAREQLRLPLRNRMSAVGEGLIAALSSRDAHAAAEFFAERLTYDDRRRLGGNGWTSRQDYLRSAERIVQQYSHFESQTLAVRGERYALVSSRLSDPAGNEAANLHVFELDDEGLISYEGRFDEDDFAGAYRMLEERYYAVEGKAFAAAGLLAMRFQMSLWAHDLAAAEALAQPGFTWQADPSALKPAALSLDEMFTWRAERLAQVVSLHDWMAALKWLSPEVCVGFVEMRGIGHHDEEYRWPRYYVLQIRDGLAVFGREFDIADEDAAFAYADALVAGERSRLLIRNRASVLADRLIAALSANNGSAAAALFAEHLTYDDRRRLGGNAVTSRQDYRRSVERLLQQYSRFENHTLAVRGERYALASSRVSDPAGNESGYLHVFELDEQGLISYEGRFDEDDFLSAYVELDRRYYAGEGAEFADSGSAAAGWVEGIGRRDVEMVRRFSTPDFRWIAAPSSLKAPERTVEDMFDWLHGRGERVTSQRHWQTVIRWVSPMCGCGLVEVSAVGPEGDEYRWNYIVAAQVRDGRVAWVREFDTEDEAFDYAESVADEWPSRLAIANRASAVTGRILAEMRARHPDAAAAHWAESFVYDDRRAMSGEPIATQAEMRDALERIMIQYDRFQNRTLAVRGERISLSWLCWSDSEGNQSPTLDLAELGDDDRVIFEVRFDEDDFETAFVELERRYYAGEGEEFAEAGAVMTAVVTVGNSDWDKVFDELFAPSMVVESRSRTIVPNRTLEEYRASVHEYTSMVSSSLTWYAAVRWLSPTCAVVRQEREAIGLEGQKYEWSRIYALEIHGGRITASCEFDVEFEDQAFAYAEERLRVSASRLAVKNRASTVGDLLADAIRAGDIDRAIDFFPAEFEYVDRRRLSGDPIVGPAARRAAIQRVLKHFNKLDMTHIAVRGDHLVLAKCRRSDNAGNESIVLVLGQINTDDRLAAYIVFDEDDFDTAYGELERRYYAGEGATSAGAGQQLTDFLAAINRGELDSAFRLINNPHLRIETRSRALFPDRSTAELREDLANLLSMASSVRWWYSDMRWLSPTVCVGRQEREAIGTEGERYAWTDIYAFEWHGDVVTWVCRFNLEDEEQAFAAAEERMLFSRSRLAVSNRASATRYSCSAAIQHGDIDAAANLYSDDLEYEDYRRLSGELPVGRAGMRAAFAKLRDHYTRFGGRFLAVRGERLALAEYICSDDAGNQTSGLTLTETGDDGLIRFEARFDEDDFESAYRELERRYYADEGEACADYGMTIAEYFATKNRGDLDTLFSSLTSPDLRIESRSHSVFVVRSAAEHRSSLEELARLVGSAREWASAVHHVSATWGLCRYQREATGGDGEDYQWERIAVAEVREGRLHFVCDFEVEDEDTAFAYAEERARASATRLPLANRAAEAIIRMGRALSCGDTDAVVDAYREDYCRDDRRRLAGELLRGRADMRSAVDRMLKQFSRFQWRILAVRGQGSAMGWTRWSDSAGNVSTYLFVGEVDNDDRIVYEGRFDEDDFESAYHELDRRFFAGEGAAFTGHGPLQTAFMDAVNRVDVEAAKKVCLPSFRVQSPPTTLAVEERSLDEFFRWLAERAAQAPSVRHWMSAENWLADGCGVSRIEIQSIGSKGGEYSWPRIAVSELRGGRIAHIRQFDVDDEEAAFAYADAIVVRQKSRLPSTNIASEVGETAVRVMNTRDVDAVLDFYSDAFVFDDHRLLSGEPIVGKAAMRAAVGRILSRYTTFEPRCFALRGTRLMLGATRWSDDAGNETAHLHVVETGEDGRIVYAGRFDEDDFVGAYLELERRYYAGEGAAFAQNGLVSADYMTLMNRGDFDTMINERTREDFQIENRSRSAFPDRSAAGLRTSLEQLYSMVESVRNWSSAIAWVSPTTQVMRMEREAVGLDGEPYAWSRILVCSWKDGQLASLCDFEVDDEDAAFTYAEGI